MSALILNYHLIDTQDYAFDDFGGIYAVTLKQFREQMDLLNDLNIRVVPLNQLMGPERITDFCVSITVDDGNPSDFEVVYPCLNQYGYTADFFLSVQNLDRNGVNWDNYREMAAEGFGIGSHGMTHQDMTRLSPAEIRFELEASKGIIEDKLGRSPVYFSLPFGRYNKQVVSTARECGYSRLFSTGFELYDPGQPHYVAGRLSLKRSQNKTEFERLLRLDKTTLVKYELISLLSRAVISGIGSNMTNKLNTLRNKIRHL